MYPTKRKFIMSKKAEEDFIENINSRREIQSQFVVSNKIFKKASSGRNYIYLTLTDKTGQIKGLIFSEENIEEIYGSIRVGSVCEIDGKVNEYPIGSGRFNIIVKEVKELSEGEYDLDEFIRTSEKNKKELIKEVEATIESIENPHLKNLLKSFFCDNSFAEKFYNAPAAKTHHHNYIGGLLDHTVEVLKISKTVCEIFPEMDEDILYTGVLLHDIGKIRTYDYDLLSIRFSEEGRLLDHLYMSSEMVKEKVNELQVPEELSTQVLHMILSHHGVVSNGWGSTVDPKTPEAVALHYADDMDAKVKEIFQH